MPHDARKFAVLSDHSFMVAEGEHVLLALGVAPNHGVAVGIVLGDVVHHVVAEVEVGRAFHGKRLEQPLVVIGFAHVALMDVPR